jgi:hypothetical protein
MKNQAGPSPEQLEQIRREWQKVMDDPDLDRVEAFERGLKLGLETATTIVNAAFDSVDVEKLRKSLKRTPPPEN